jgi:hypothetical protein
MSDHQINIQEGSNATLTLKTGGTYTPNDIIIDIVGTQGLQGYKGIQGTQGYQGLQGYKGTNGSNFIQSLTGAALTLTAYNNITINSTTSLSLSSSYKIRGERGDTFLVTGIVSDKGVYICIGNINARINGNYNEITLNITSKQIIKDGAQGIQGYQGLQGPAGSGSSGNYWSLNNANPENGFYNLTFTRSTDTICSKIMEAHNSVSDLKRITPFLYSREIYVDVSQHNDGTSYIHDLIGYKIHNEIFEEFFPCGIRYNIYIYGVKTLKIDFPVMYGNEPNTVLINTTNWHRQPIGTNSIERYTVGYTGLSHIPILEQGTDYTGTSIPTGYGMKIEVVRLYGGLISIDISYPNTNITTSTSPQYCPPVTSDGGASGALQDNITLVNSFLTQCVENKLTSAEYVLNEKGEKTKNYNFNMVDMLGLMLRAIKGDIEIKE